MFCLMKSSTTDSTALTSTCWPGPNSVHGMLLFTVWDSELAIASISWCRKGSNRTITVTHDDFTYPLLCLFTRTNYADKEMHTFMTVSKVTLSFTDLVGVSGKEVWSVVSGLAILHLQQDVSRGRAFLKMLTIRMLMGNIMSELWTPIMNCCQVNSKWPGRRESRRM